MPYELVIVPPDYDKHIVGENSTCVYCNEKVDIVDYFVNDTTDDGVPLDAPLEYQSILTACPQCRTHQLELLTGEVSFRGPITAEWS